MTMKTSLTAISALVVISLGVVASGCGGDDSTATNAGSAGTPPARQAAAGDGSPGPAPCATTTYRDGFIGVGGDIYISCIDQPIRVWVSDVDPYDFSDQTYPDRINGPNKARTGPGTVLPPSSHLTNTYRCYIQARSVGWKMGVTFADGSKASVRVQLPVKGWRLGRPLICENGGDPGFWVEFNTPEGKGLMDVVLTSDTGKRVRLVAKKSIDMPDWTSPAGFDLPYRPIFIESVLKK